MTLNVQNSCVIMVVILISAVLCVEGISIDGQLTVIRNDCYERMAIGEKLSPKQTYKTFDHNTVSKCEMECTQEKETCRAYSFGIGRKGNATCFLSRNPVKETADLKPIGTISDTDYDLYIKKLDCHVVVGPPQQPETEAAIGKPQAYGANPSSNGEQQQQNGYGIQEHHQDDQNGHYGNLPAQSNYHNSVSNLNQGPESGYHYDKPQNQFSGNTGSVSHQPSKEDELHHVQTLVSVASGPHNVLHPVHNILVSQGSYGEGKPPISSSSESGYGEQNGDRPPFRPPALNHPYDDHRRPFPDQEVNQRPDPEYGNLRPSFASYGYGYGYGYQGQLNGNNRIGPYLNDFNTPYGASPPRPHPNDDRPDSDCDTRPLKVPDYRYGSGGTQYMIDRRKYESTNQFNSVKSEIHRYRPEQPKLYEPSYNFYDHYEKPSANYPNRYGSVIPHPNDYSRPDNDYLFVRPNSGPDRPGARPEYDERRPSNAGTQFDYDRSDRPVKPRPQYDDHKPSQHDRPEYDWQRPLNNGLNSEYGRPELRPPLRPGDSQNYDRPSKLDQNWNKVPTNSYDQPTSSYPTKRPGDFVTSKPPSTELSNHYGGVDYTNKQYGKPGEYYNDKGDGGLRKVITQSVGFNGEKITSIITELPNACFRRALAGKRVVRSLVRKLLICDTIEQCQQECGDERRFTCEAFNYRLDPTGRGKGECELLDLPLSRIDLTREIVTDPDYDFYTRDRNAAQVNCRQLASNSYFPSGGGYGGGGGRDDDRRGGGGRDDDRRGGGGRDEDRRGGGGYRYGYHDDEENRRDEGRRPFDRRPTDIGRPLRGPGGDRWDGDYGDPSPPRPPPADPRPLPEDQRRHEYDNRRGDYSFHHSHESHSSHSHSYHYNEHNVDKYDYHEYQDHRPYSGIHYLPASPVRRPSYDIHRPDDRYIPPKRFPVIIPLDDKYPSDPLPSRYPSDRYPPDRYRTDRYHGDKLPEKDYWGINPLKWGPYGGRYGDRYRYEHNRNNYYIPTRPSKQDIPDDWGLYGGSYGTGSLALEYQGYGNRQTYDYWGFNKFDRDRKPISYGDDLLPPRKPGSYLPAEKLGPGGSYLPLPRPNIGGSYLPTAPSGYDLADNSILPAEPRRPPNFNFIRDECSLRSATGFRLHKGVVKKFFSVPNIYECELLCVREKDFPCDSYAFRYTLSLNNIVDNCYLSNRNYKELDYYTDLEPDRDYDIYTMNNRRKCQEPGFFLERKDSDCFWRVRSGQRLDHSVVRDSLTVKSIVDCQLECLKSRRFTCRAYSFRYGSPIIGGAIDNCQLTDWPFYELDPRVHFIPEREFEIYERGSYGHGCEPNHFGIRGRIPSRDNGIKVDQLCYIGFGSAAKLLPQATIKSVFVPTELDCKVECSKAREGTIFRCMTFSFVTGGPKVGHNCFLSDIMQRDLLPTVDYVHDPDSWLFTWDNYNPECVDLAYKPLHKEGSDKGIGHVDYLDPLNVWKVYSVSGWPCKRGTFCKENREAGFWYCELEGADKSAWDYCCSPDHQCGFSNGYPYSWCYVGPSRTQWRKCNDQYYPYIHNVLDRFDSSKRPWHTSGYVPPPPQTPGYRPDRPNTPVKPAPPRPSLDQYEHEFDQEFLSPPKPGGFGQPRRWPVAYLHKEMPPNATDLRTTRTEKSENTKLAAIKSLINVIQNTEIQNVQYHISNDSSKSDDILYVKIPLPNLDDEPENNTTEQTIKKTNELSSNTKVNFEVVDTAHGKSSRVQKSLPIQKEVTLNGDIKRTTQVSRFTTDYLSENNGKFPTFRRGFVTRTNVTGSRRYRSF